ncbi:phosphatidylinositol 4-phosphate 3-kinase C2 domain-containing subunit alpha isoform X2 [Tetranychus urticae]|uniref:phosphatidylinositol 4-phosphate 3-kinase C2 domain-containing subunit alpha isoform X2 n=1 Tax=Tetranychus urticae TaxID=32264 RepID=UPI00077BBA93|nr:phosphatidylinositol 4-phosphate 3-kinase C2 domain-containing subunit alpha isoform X2 [Tetranychus urticae]
MNEQFTRDQTETKPALPPRLFIRPPPRKPTVINELKLKVPLPRRMVNNQSVNGPTIELSKLIAPPPSKATTSHRDEQGCNSVQTPGSLNDNSNINFNNINNNNNNNGIIVTSSRLTNEINNSNNSITGGTVGNNLVSSQLKPSPPPPPVSDHGLMSSNGSQSHHHHHHHHRQQQQQSTSQQASSQSSIRSYQPSNNPFRTNAPNTLCLSNNNNSNSNMNSSSSTSSASPSPSFANNFSPFSSSTYAIVSPIKTHPGKPSWIPVASGTNRPPALSHSNSFPYFDPFKRDAIQAVQQLNTNHQQNQHSNSTRLFNSNSVQNLSYFYSSVTSQVNNEAVREMLEKIRKLGELEKLPNENLIDLGPNYSVNPQDDLLHLFDPLMISEGNDQENSDSIDSDHNQNSDEGSKEISDGSSSPQEPISPPTPIRVDSIDSTSSPSESSATTPSIASQLTVSSENENGSNNIFISSNNTIPADDNFRVRFRTSRADPELISFAQKVYLNRNKFAYSDKLTNPGFVASTRLDYQLDCTLSVKLQIYHKSTESPISFTCNVNTSVEHVVCHAVCSIFEGTNGINFDEFVLKINSLNEYLTKDSTLADYAYIHQCHMFDEDVRLTLINTNETCHNIYARNHEDDESVTSLSPDDLLPQPCVCKFGEINRDMVNILLETLEKEISKLVFNSSKESIVKTIKGVIQATKALCSLFGNCDTLQVTEAIENLSQLSLVYDQYKKRGEIILNQLSEEQLQVIHKEVFHHAIVKLKRAIREMINLYCSTFPVDFELIPQENLDTEPKTLNDESKSPCSLSQMSETLLVYVGTVNCLSFDWKMRYREFYISCEIWFGENLIGNCKTGRVPVSQGLFQRLVFNELLHFQTVLLSSLPRESYLYFNLYGIEFPSSSSLSSSSSSTITSTSNAIPSDQSSANGEKKTPKLVALSVLKLLDFQEKLVQGSVLLGMWTGEIVSKTERTCFNSSNLEKGSPLIIVNLPDHGCDICFPSIDTESSINTYIKQDLNLLDSASQTDIHVILNSDPVQQMSRADENIIWDHRHYLHELPSALPKVLKAAPSWKWSYLNDIYHMIQTWNSLPAVDAMQLLLPAFLDKYVRSQAVTWISRLRNDEICDYLPQLIQALRFEPYFDSALIWFLLEKAYSSVRIAHNLYWLLKQNLDDPIFSFRSRIYLNALLLTCGEALRTLFENQEALLSKLSFVSDHLKSTKGSQRMVTLTRDLEPVDDFLLTHPLALPLSPSMHVIGLNIKSCFYFNSNTLPIKLAFKSEQSSSCFTQIDAMYKVGDDLRQDSFTMQMIKIMDKLWLKEGLDLKIVTFGCIATDFRKGFVEIVKNAETLRKIQTEYGITGSFRDSCISEWLQKHNTSELEYRKSVENFTYSLAGYVVVTYVLGIGDRHNDNIMITTSGHLFHIDFGKYLGDAQMLGAIKRDRTPFILTSDMAYVINGGDKPSKQFQYFVDLCCQAFNIIRRHTNLFLNLFSLMVSSGIPGLSIEAVKYIHRTLLPSLTEAEATAAFNKMIGETLSSVSTKFNFFLHNLAQLRFTSDHNDPSTLSFVPKKYTKETDGRIIGLRVESYFKKYEPEKVYIYVIRVEREHQKDPAYVYRSYREFYELHQKMTSLFPLVRLYPLNRSSSFMGRSNTREVAEKRAPEIDFFLLSLMHMTEEIAHSDIVYTFFHPILRDQEAFSGQGQSGSSSLHIY